MKNDLIATLMTYIIVASAVTFIVAIPTLLICGLALLISFITGFSFAATFWIGFALTSIISIFIIDAIQKEIESFKINLDFKEEDEDLL
jgi:undecaprenyl pyrophosphate phosphatase UppP